ncbi:PLD nuclease N-terminal domain-containing protein [Streptomyces sp. WAC06614]|uniref:PLD nuclease N-terminal domain-containing protein n=1 Tax=Streptomyces sp. WAC06614 TaxID=2487416 RepID=UPI000F7A4984|nr:PLD nuclease N-terminal domain-containing protein [Streptomyces sp. WAC06614]RSS79545.1 PLDc_N domain-containing protein [Streptomyces sp. WAC06614]
MLRYLPFLLVIALTIYAFIDCLNTPEEEVKHLPKVVWVIIILLFSIVGPVVWLFAGKQRSLTGGGFPTAGGRARRTPWVAPDDNPEFLRSLDQRDEDKDQDQDKGDGKGDTKGGA